MALKINPGAQLVFFEKLYGAGAAQCKMAKKLTEYGSFEVGGLYEIRFKQGSAISTHQLTVGATTIIKEQANPALLYANRVSVGHWLESLHTMIVGGGETVPYSANYSVQVPKSSSTTVPGTFKVPAATTTATTVAEPEKTPFLESNVPFLKTKVFRVFLVGKTPGSNKITIIKVLRDHLPLSVKEAKLIVETASVEFPRNLADFPDEEAAAAFAGTLNMAGCNTIMKPFYIAEPPAINAHTKSPLTKPVNEVINLRDAKALNQKVHGTSHGSVYYTIAYNQRVKLAAKIHAAGSVSIRAEWQGATKDELTALQAMGLVMKENYASAHYSMNGVPPSRLIGAVLLSSSIKFEEQVQSSSQLVVS